MYCGGCSVARPTKLPRRDRNPPPPPTAATALLLAVTCADSGSLRGAFVGEAALPLLDDGITGAEEGEAAAAVGLFRPRAASINSLTRASTCFCNDAASLRKSTSINGIARDNGSRVVGDARTAAAAMDARFVPPTPPASARREAAPSAGGGSVESSRGSRSLLL